MTAFQIVALGGLAGLLLWELRALSRQPGQGIRWLRGLVWLGAGVAIAWPDLTMTLAQSVGIGRGADLLLYLFVLGCLGVGFYIYARMVRLQRQVTQLVRHLALQDARRGGQRAE